MTVNVANNVANEKVQDYVKKSHNMTENEQKSEKNLTEQWKNGELEVGEYYLRYKDGTIDREYYDYVRLYEMVTLKGFSTEDCEISEILAPVPSYEKWNAVLESNENLFKTIQVLKEENAKLKETIKRTKANGNYPSRVSAYKSRIATLCEENAKLKELLSKCVLRVDTLSDVLDFLKDKVVYKQSKQLADILKSTRDIIKEIDEVLK